MRWIKRPISRRERVVGGLAGGGGAIILGVPVQYLLLQVMHLNLILNVGLYIALEAAGIILLTLAVVVNRRK